MNETQPAIWEFTCLCGEVWTAGGELFEGSVGSCSAAAIDCPTCGTFTRPARRLLVAA